MLLSLSLVFSLSFHPSLCLHFLFLTLVSLLNLLSPPPTCAYLCHHFSFISLSDFLLLSLPFLPSSFISFRDSLCPLSLFCSPLGLSDLIFLFSYLFFFPFSLSIPLFFPICPLSPSLSTSSLPYFYLPLPFLPLFLTHVSLSLPIFPSLYPLYLSVCLLVSSFIPPGISFSPYLLISPVSFSVLYFLPTHVIFSLSLFLCPTSTSFLPLLETWSMSATTGSRGAAERK